MTCGGEYSHGDLGLREYLDEMLRIAGNSPSRNRPCPCGSGSKYKRCHLDEVEEAKRRISRQRLFAGPGTDYDITHRQLNVIVP